MTLYPDQVFMIFFGTVHPKARLPAMNNRDRDYNVIGIGCHKILYKRLYELTEEINKIDKTVNRIHQVALASAQYNRLRKVYHSSQQT